MRIDRADRHVSMRGVRPILALLLLLGYSASALPAQQSIDDSAPESGYILPPPSVQELLSRDTNFATLDQISPDRNHFLVPISTELSTLERMGEETYRLGMLELRPKVDRHWHLDTYGIKGFRVFALADRSFTDVSTPTDAFISDFTWSPEGGRIAYLVHERDRTRVWVTESGMAEASPLSDAHVMTTIGTDSGNQGARTSRMLQWVDEEAVLTLLVPEGRGAEPQKPSVAKTPLIRSTFDRPAPTRTFPFLLEDDHDAALFVHYTSSQIAELRPGQPPRRIGEPGMYESIRLSPDGRHILATRYVQPLSFLTRYADFPRVTEVLDMDGNVLSVLEERPLQVALEDEGRDAEPRDLAWRPDGSGISFLQRDSRGDLDQGEPRRDRVYLLEAPFQLEDARVVAVSDQRIAHIAYDLSGDQAFVTLVRNGREAIARLQLGSGVAEPEILVDYFDPQEVTKHPGQIFTQETGNGNRFAVLSSTGDHAFLVGEGLNEDFRPQPFVDRLAVADGDRDRVFEGSRDMWERPLVPLDRDFSRIVVSRESKTSFPDSYLWSAEGTPERLTDNIDPFPEVTAARRVDFEFERRDGVRIQARLSLPIDYQEGQRVPALVWTYPREYDTAEDYARAAIRTTNHNAFHHMTWLRWSDIWLTQGFARIDPDIPIIAEETIGGHYNDMFIPSLVDAMHALIREVDGMGVVDIDRMGHGGHSYGAFATVNYLAHTSFFKAGIAGSGAYNRTLTPLGFQAERRSIWEAPQTYMAMSPFFQVHRVNTPLLMYHGADDNNTGTYPVQSERLMHALTGLGKPAVLYMYPYESHSLRAIETVGDKWARWLDWFNRYVAGEDVRADDADGVHRD